MSFTKKIVTTYAKSLFQNVSAKQTKTPPRFLLNKENFDVSKITSFDGHSNLALNVYIIGEELSLIRSTLISSKKLKFFFNNPTYVEQQKLDVLFDIFPGLTVTTKSFLKILTERSHLSLLPEVSEEYNQILLKFKNSTRVKLITASLLQENYGLALLRALKILTSSSEIILNISYNPKLLGGLILEYNSISTDASILKEFSLFFNEI
jgi:ATP synthase F1 delta subunit